MPRLPVATLRRLLLRGTSLAAIVLLTAVAMRLFGPQPTRGQATNLGAVQVTSLAVVGADGTVLARLQAGPAGNGQLALLDVAGKTRTVLTGNGSLVVFDADGVTPRFEAGYRPFAGANGVPPVNGVLIDPTGTIDYLPSSP